MTAHCDMCSGKVSSPLMSCSLLTVVCCSNGEPRPSLLLKSELAGSFISQKFNNVPLKPKDIISKSIREYIVLSENPTSSNCCCEMKEILFQVHRFKWLLQVVLKLITLSRSPHKTLSEMSTAVTPWTIVGASLLSYLLVPDAPHLFQRGTGFYSRGPGFCRQQIQPINVSAIIPSDSFWGFIVRWTVNGVEGRVRRAVMICLSRLCFKQPNVSQT